MRRRRRLTPILLNAATALCAIVVVATTVTGAWGYVSPATATLWSEPGHRDDLVVGTSGGMLFVNRVVDLESRDQAEDFDDRSIGVTRVYISAGTRQYRGNGVSMWTLLIMTGPIPAFRAVRVWQRRRHSESGACPTCGYDLRATPDRCPECGAVPPPPPPPA